MKYTKNIKAFTLIELIVVIAIIAVLSAMGIGFYTRYQDQARATKIVNDFRTIEKAWRTWKSAGHPRYPWEDDTAIIPGGTTNGEMSALGCTMNDPEMSKTPIHTSGADYLDAVLTDSFSRQYAYDYDRDVFSAAATEGGVNIMLFWCGTAEQTRYATLLPIIDEMIDNGDANAATGKFFWTAGTNSKMWYNISVDALN